MIYWKVLPTTETFPIDGNNDGDTVDPEDIIEADAADAAHFKISMDGVLNFKSPPDYENPMGGDTNTTTYNIVVVSSDDAPGATTDGMVPAIGNLPKMAYHKVTVTVTDVDEDGSVSLSGLQPQAGVAFTATLKDDDAADTQINAAKWKWEQSSAMNGPWTLISGAIAAEYTPASDVADMYLRATATYTDKHGDDKPAMAVSAHAVREEPAGGNAAPVFDDDIVRSVNENSPPGTNVGKPVTAGDAGDVLTYTLAAAADSNDNGLYTIDPATGQIMVGPRTTLNAEATSGPGGIDRVTSGDDAEGLQHQVTVIARDPHVVGTLVPDGETDDGAEDATVTITIKNVNESPRFTAGPTRDKQDENEDTNINTTDIVDIPTLAYAVTDVDAGDTNDTIRWTLEGADKDALKITKDTSVTPTDAASSAMLQFKKSPNYEKPIDANKDNVYMVTVVATDKKKLTATRDVVITVTNADDNGVITFSSEQPKVRIDFTATLTDEDGGVDDEKVKWQWAAVTGADCTNVTFETDGSDDIDKAKSDTYTPATSPPTNVGQCLQATATYTDSNGSGKTISDISANPVVDNLDNAIPEFREGGDKPVTQAARYILESAEADANVVVNPDGITASPEDPSRDPVMATDPNPADTNLTHTLGGRDKDSFAIASDNGQITVKTGTKLDYEKKNSYMVTVTATDPSLASATIDVTINVVNVNESPVIAGEDDITKEFRENSTSTIQTFSATDPERRTVYWSLGEGDSDYPDDAFFTISKNGALSFKEGRDFEAPADVGADNTYKVIVVASDDASNIGVDTYTDTANMSERKFTVQVTHVRETGSITVDRLYPQVEVVVEAALTDGDATPAQITAATWQWYKGTTELSGNGAESETYTPQGADVGNLKVEATYNAKGDERKASKSITVRAAPTGINADADPAFESSTTARSVDEGKANANVGAPIKATDDTPVDSGKLTYSVNPNTDFSIDNNGQLKTKVALDHEDPPALSLTVTATDPSGRTGEVTVTVTINDVNEAPMIATGPTKALPKPENTPTTGTNAVVAIYTASDPETDEDDDLVWSLTGADATDFYIGNQDGGTRGTLTFKKMPDYEKPAASNNVYRVTVEVSDGKLKATRPMTVTVTDVEEEGEVKLSTVAPRVAVELTASLEDSDGGETDVTWQWWKSVEDNAATAPNFLDSNGDPDTIAWTKIDDAESDTYEPVKDDLGRWLAARASYTDRRGEGKTATDVSDSAVIANNDNRAPMFKENDVEITETTRKVAENVDAGTLFGDGMDGDDTDVLDNEEPVEATDPNTDKLTYTLGGPDEASFDIGRGTGQLETKAKLDYETKNSYMVTVTATDPHGLSATTDVTINVTDMDEAPKIIVGGLVVTGTSAPDYPEKGTGMVATYTALGPDAASATWSLSGADMGDFSISSAGVLTFVASPNYESPADANTDNIYMVMVNANDGTNDAMKAVTVRVTNEDEPGRVTFWRDGADATTAAIVVGDELGGAVDDADGNPGDPFPIAMYKRIAAANVTSWQWAKSMTPDMMDSWMDIQDATGAAYMVMEGDNGYYLRATAMYDDGEGMGKMASMQTMMVTASPMFDSETAERMVPENTAAGENVGAPVTAMDADNDTLTYSLGGTDMASFTVDNMGQIMVGDGTMLDYEIKASYMVTVTASDGSASDSIDVMVMVTNVEEMGEVTLWAGMDALTMAPQVGDTITGAVMDPDGNPGDMPPIAMDTRITAANVTSWQWAKSMTPDMMDSWMPITGATDAAYMVMEGDNGYYLRATASYTDGEGSDKSAMAVSAYGVVSLSIAGERSVSHEENDTDAVATYEAMGPQAAGATWSLSGADADDFSIDSAGELTFAATPNYEAATDADTDNVYEVTVVATAGTNSQEAAVTVTVANMDEDGTVSLTTMNPVVGTELTASVDDPDGSVTGTTWQWARSPDGMDGTWTDIEGAINAAYTPGDADDTMFLRVMASYTDGEGSGKSAMAESDAVAGEESLLDRYDADDNGEIEIGEARTAVAAYFRDEITLEDARAVVALYFASP